MEQGAEILVVIVSFFAVVFAVSVIEMLFLY
jgi:nitrogen fixation protein FixH